MATHIPESRLPTAIPLLLERLARDWFEACRKAQIQAIDGATFEESWEFEEAVDNAGRELEAVTSRLAAGDRASMANTARDVLAQAGVSLKETEPEFDVLCGYLLRASAEASRILLANLEGDRRAKPTDPLFVPREDEERRGWRP
ncbi:MAG: hypothetical protein ABT940_10505 [Alphaproteobacteria bacterium]